jgi:phosphatidylglycerophosphatase A
MSTPESTRLPVALATWFGAGRLRPAPGTWGSAAAACIALGLLLAVPDSSTRPTILAAAIVVTVVGVWASAAAQRHFGVADPSSVVIDEVAGVLVAVAILPAAMLAEPMVPVVTAFLLFRVFDIAKPWPVSWCEHLPGGWGIMADDLAAGLLAGLLTTAILA